MCFFSLTFFSYTASGYRVIALSKRDLDPSVNYKKIQRMERNQAEKDLEFLGLIILENRQEPKE